jgi:molecular chaperone GrpE (heat shock protein)
MNADQDPSEMESASDAGANAVSAPDIGALQTELAVQRGRYLRLSADFDNFRKRTARETERSAAAQKEAFIRELLPVIDNLERALGSDVSTSPERLGQGVQMTLQQLTTQLLRHHGIEADESLGRPFDPLYHEAVSVRHDPLNLTMSYLGPISAVIAAATKSFGRPKWSSVIQLRPKRAAETMTIRYPKCHRLGVSEYWARSCMVEHHRGDSRR